MEAKGMCPCCWFQTTRPASVVGRQPTNTAAVRSRTWTSQTALHVRREPVLALKPFDMGPRPGSQRSKGNTSTDKKTASDTTDRQHDLQTLDGPAVRPAALVPTEPARPVRHGQWRTPVRPLWDHRQQEGFRQKPSARTGVPQRHDHRRHPRRAILDRIAAAGRRIRAD